jgi:hypothetical protein
MFEPASANTGPLKMGYLGTGGILKGQLGMVDSDTIIDATEGQSTAVLFGVAAESGDAGDVVPFYPLIGKLFKVPVYQASTVDDVTDAMVGGVDYDMIVDSTDHKLDLNDTSGPMMHIVSYDNDEHTAIVQFIAALCVT